MFELHENKKRTLSLVPRKGNGEIGAIDGVPSWSMSPEGLAVLTVSEDGMSAVIDWVAAGTVIVKATADGDLSDNVFEIMAEETFVMVPSLGAETVSIVVSDEEPV